MITTHKIISSIKSLFIVSALFVSLDVKSSECNSIPFFKKVDHVGAVGADDWTTGWTEYNPSTENYETPQIIIDKPILTDYTMKSHKTYLLKGKVYVAPGATLHIEPGTVIRGDKSTNATLIVSRGAQIRAMGTKNDPVVFTSNMPAGRRSSGDWGGIILLGQAKINRKAGKALMEGDLDPKLGIYGGEIDDDNSGVIQYTRIEFAGRKIDQSNEINALSLAAVGNRTTLDHIQVSFTKDDSFEFYGGTVNASHLISFKCLDDDFDMSYGYSGSLQFGIALRHPRTKDFSGSNGIEIDSYASDDNLASINQEMHTNCTISNFTIVSPKSSLQGVTQLSQGIMVGNDAYLSVYNSVILGFNFGIFIKTKKSEQGISSGKSNFENNFFVGSKYPIGNSTNTNSELNDYFVNPRLSNFHYAEFSGPLLEDPYNLRFPRFHPAKGSKLSKGASFKKINYDQMPFEADKLYVGSAKETNWLTTWTNFAPEFKTYPDANTPVSGNLNSKTVWTSGKTYLLKGTVTVNDELIIKAGTVIKGDKASKGTLVIGTKGKLIVEGTKTSPVIFTSNLEEGSRNAGDWGGIVVLNNSKVNDKVGSTLYKSQLVSLPNGPVFGGKDESKSSGSIKYARIEFAGAKLTTHENSALTLAGVSCMDIDYLQISHSEGNGISWIGGKSNSQHIVCFSNKSNDFVPTLGYSGTVRYGVVLRDEVKATKNANAIESMGSKDVKFNIVKTTAKFKNFTIIGPKKTDLTPVNANYNAGIYIHSNSSLSIDNSIIIGYPVGFAFSSVKTDFALASGEMTFQNNIIAGMKNPYAKYPNSRIRDYDVWLSDNGNVVEEESASVKLNKPYDKRNPDLTPVSGSPAIKILR